MGVERIVAIAVIAERLRVAESTVSDPRWRRRVGLLLVKVGGRVVGAFEDDVQRVLLAGRERIEACP